MRFKKISARMIACILPVILVAMAILTTISAVSSKQIIEEQIANHMSSELTAQLSQIEEYLNLVSTTAGNLSKTVGNTYQEVAVESYLTMLKQTIASDDFIMGSGIWFEPYVYESMKKYMGPYVYKDGSETKVTYDYSNEQYDYFNQEYYMNAKNSKNAVFTDPYYDETSGKIMSSCSMAITDAKDQFIGCITVDIELTSIETLVGNIKVGDAGTAMLLSQSGVYLGDSNHELVQNGANILEDENPSLTAAASKILQAEKGTASYEGEERYQLYYDTLPELNWKLIIKMPAAELELPVTQLVGKLIVVCLVTAVLSVLAVLVQVRLISNNVKIVKAFADELSTGNFTVEPISVHTRDELGMMGTALNEMYESNKTIIANIADKSLKIDDSSEHLYEVANDLMHKFENIQEYMSRINEDMMSASAATEEVNASTEEVNASVNILAQKTEASQGMSEEIKKRAEQIGENSRKSYENAARLSAEYNQSLTKSIENAKVVENIQTLAGVISQIADQINLLALNASIEAARAGEQGRGFAVVASEIGKLANDTAHAVGEIQTTISQVQDAFNGLTKNSSSLLEFIEQTVTPDYNNFVTIADQYGKDADSIEDNANSISEMAVNINHIMNEVSSAIQSIAETSQNTANNSSEILSTVTQVSKIVDDVSVMSQTQEDISKELTGVISNFKLS